MSVHFGVTLGGHKSIWSRTNQHWIGSVTCGDVHVDLEDGPSLDSTRFSTSACTDDDLSFEDVNPGACGGGSNALMVYAFRDQIGRK